MFKTTTRDDALETFALEDTEGDSVVLIAPARGGMVTRWKLRGRDVFYLDESTLRDPTKNVRGGNPVLFPSPGKLEGDLWARAEKSGSLKQHGFARNLPWRVVDHASTGGASVALRLSSSDATRATFPWDFVAEYNYILRGPVLRIEMRFTNTGDGTLPFGAGYHPYFALSQADKGGATIGTTATQAFDNVTKKTRPVAFDLAHGETDLHLVDHGSKPCTLTWAHGAITVRGSEEFSHWVVWTVEGKDFVCVEPWTCPGNALNTGDRILELPPGHGEGATRAMWVEISVG